MLKLTKLLIITIAMTVTFAANAQTADGPSGNRIIGVVTVVGVLIYVSQKQNPTSAYNFAVIPTDTDAYVAEFNATPRENLNLNLRFTEGDLFASHSQVKPETNTTAKLTVEWTW